MAQEERLTKAERRERAREERRRKEADEAARARRRRIVSVIVGVLITAFVVWVLWLAFAGDEEIEDLRVVDPQAASDAREAAGCIAMPTDLSGNAQHFAPAEAPPAEALYSLRPTASGPHFERPIAPGVYRGGMDERGSTHSMEHGGVVVWWDPELASGDAVDDIVDFAEVLNASGFANPRSGAGIFAAEYEGSFTSGKAIALRAWGAALDCDSWDRTVADAFVVDHFGTHGIAPERNLGPYPEQLMIFGPGADETETPNGGPQFEPTDDSGDGPGEGPETDAGDTDAGTETDADEEPTQEPSASES